MAGIYVHIPFCKTPCNYCNFFFSTSTFFKNDFVKALQQEIALQQNYIQSPINTIYFGGGTPSLLSVDELYKILNTIHQYFTIEKNCEITLEANPDDLDQEKIEDLYDIGVNRLSIGIQSFYDDDLKFMKRAHDAKDAYQVLDKVFSAGFSTISIDLIYGLPNTSHWKNNLDQLKHWPIEHLSCYALTVEEGTRLYHDIRKGKIKALDEQQAAKDFAILQQWTKENNWEHYEISNLCKNKAYSKHNTAYWQGEHYLGLGPAAHSYNGKERQWNIAHLKKYINACRDGSDLFEKEVLTIEQQYNEYIMTGLRTQWGIKKSEIKERFAPFYLHFEKSIHEIRKDWLILKDDTINISDLGRFYADGIAATLFYVED